MATIKKKIKELMIKIDNQNNEGNKELEKEMLEDLASDCAKYISCIINMENSINLAKARLEPKGFQELITKLDKSRTTTHNVVISGVKVLNKLSHSHNMAPIYTEDINSRIQVAKFAKQYIDELFNERRI